MMNTSKSDNIEQNYKFLGAAIQAHLDDEPDLIANLANIAAFIYDALDNVNWAGFYLLKGDMLVLGPFVGKPACTRIPMGRGVCGTAAERGETIVVADVHEFDGHIACDSASNSEIVLPLFKNCQLFGVLDIDSPIFDRFGKEDVKGLTKIANSINSFLDKT